MDSATIKYIYMYIISSISNIHYLCEYLRTIHYTIVYSTYRMYVQLSSGTYYYRCYENNLFITEALKYRCSLIANMRVKNACIVGLYETIRHAHDLDLRANIHVTFTRAQLIGIQLLRKL